MCLHYLTISSCTVWLPKLLVSFYGTSSFTTTTNLVAHIFIQQANSHTSQQASQPTCRTRYVELASYLFRKRGGKLPKKTFFLLLLLLRLLFFFNQRSQNEKNTHTCTYVHTYIYPSGSQWPSCCCCCSVYIHPYVPQTDRRARTRTTYVRLAKGSVHSTYVRTSYVHTWPAAWAAAGVSYVRACKWVARVCVGLAAASDVYVEASRSLHPHVCTYVPVSLLLH